MTMNLMMLAIIVIQITLTEHSPCARLCCILYVFLFVQATRLSNNFPSGPPAFTLADLLSILHQLSREILLKWVRSCHFSKAFNVLLFYSEWEKKHVQWATSSSSAGPSLFFWSHFYPFPFTVAVVASWLFLNSAEHAPASESSPMLFPLHGMLPSPHPSISSSRSLPARHLLA